MVPMTTIQRMGRNLPVSFAQEASLWCEQHVCVCVCVCVCVISGFCYKADENRTLLGYYAVSCGNFLPTFRDSLSVSSLGFKNPKESKMVLEP